MNLLVEQINPNERLWFWCYSNLKKVLNTASMLCVTSIHKSLVKSLEERITIRLCEFIIPVCTGLTWRLPS